MARAHSGWGGPWLQFRPDPTRQVGPPVSPPLKKYIYIYIKNIQEIENATLIKIFIANYFIH